MVRVVLGRRVAHRLLVSAGALALLTLEGCYQVPSGKHAVSTVELEGTHDVDDDDLRDHLATVESPRFFGIKSGFVYDYELFDRHALRRDLARVERYLRARGYYDARVRATRIVEDGNKVHVRIEVDQGEPVVVSSVAIVGDRTLEPGVREALSAAPSRHLPVGARLDEGELENAEQAVLTAMTARGYAAAKVERRAEVDVATRKASIVFTVEPGPLARVGRIDFTGLGDLDQAAVRRVFGLQTGELYSSEEIETSRLALLDLGVFSSVEVEPDLRTVATTHEVPLTVHTEPGKIHALLAGFGVQFDALKTDGHLLAGWRSSNFLGGLRNFELRFRPGIVLYPTRLPDVKPPTDYLFEERLVATLRQPAFLERRTAGVARAEYNVYPILFPGNKISSDVAGYHEVRSEVGLERSFGRFFGAPSYGIQANFPFDYLGRTPGLDRILISYTELFTYLDLRDNPIQTRKGIYLSNELQFAGGPLQGNADDVRLQPELRGFVPLPKKITIATRASLGFLFPRNYGDAALQAERGDGQSVPPGLERDYQLLFFRGFFGGGPSSNRGYPLRGIGPHALVPRSSPAGQSIAAAGCAEGEEKCTLPTGGRSLWEANVEVRFVISGPLSSAVFCDSGDVSPFAVDLRLDRPHLSCGAGARYDTPVGPIRLDIGYRIPGVQYPRGARGEVPPEDLLGLPIALAFGIGEAY